MKRFTEAASNSRYFAQTYYYAEEPGFFFHN